MPGKGLSGKKQDWTGLTKMWKKCAESITGIFPYTDIPAFQIGQTSDFLAHRTMLAVLQMKGGKLVATMAWTSRHQSHGTPNLGIPQSSVCNANHTKQFQGIENWSALKRHLKAIKKVRKTVIWFACLLTFTTVHESNFPVALQGFPINKVSKMDSTQRIAFSLWISCPAGQIINIIDLNAVPLALAEEEIKESYVKIIKEENPIYSNYIILITNAVHISIEKKSKRIPFVWALCGLPIDRVS